MGGVRGVLITTFPLAACLAETLRVNMALLAQTRLALERPGRPKIENLSVFHESAVPRTAGYNRGAISADAGRSGAGKSGNEPGLGQTREANGNDCFEHGEIRGRAPESLWPFPARVAAICLAREGVGRAIIPLSR